ncbi:LuxR C-terminal-related transcriptional regulator [Polaribacter tangerinus]|uniref:LuxR C-terminal-related transcriptional regulator n=1 Tax=Polaribacter tangerinus TaxID=1920034 RepID=UPI000B4B1FE2|nr:LuxR C-terminal-related transcriptional regulator [Polaribacter tangerinus]
MNLELFEKVFSTIDKVNQDVINRHLKKIKELSVYLPKTQSYFMLQDTVNQSIGHLCENYSRILGYNKNETLEKGLPFHFSNYHPEDVENWQKTLNELMQFTMKEIPEEERSNCTYTWTYRIKTKKGKYLNIQECLTPIYFDSYGKPLVGFSQSTVIDSVKKQAQIGVCKKLNNNGEYETLFYKNYSKNILLDNLSNRELDIVRLLSLGLSTKEISDRLNISSFTTSTHRRNILAKLDFNSTAEITKYCLTHQLF